MDETKSNYDQQLFETREKCLPLLERVVKKFPEYKKVCEYVQKQRPTVKWLKKLMTVCKKIEDSISVKSAKKLDETKRRYRKDSVFTLEKDNAEEVNSEIQSITKTYPQKQSRLDTKPSDYFSKVKNETLTYCNNNIRGNKVKKNVPVVESKHTVKTEKLVIDLTDDHHTNKQNLSGQKLKNMNNQDLDVEIIASVAGHNPSTGVRTQSQFTTSKEANESLKYKQKTSDNMILHSQGENLKLGTVVDLVKSKTQRRLSLKRKPEWVCRTPEEEKEYSTHENNYFNNVDKKLSLVPKNPFLNPSVKCIKQTKEQNTLICTKESDSIPPNTKSGSEFEGNLPFYKQNNNRNCRKYYYEKPFSTQFTTQPVSFYPPDLCPVSNEILSSKQSVNKCICADSPQLAWSFRQRCDEVTQYYYSGVLSPQPTPACLVGNNFHFSPQQNFSNQLLILPLSTNPPSPFPNHGIPPPSKLAAFSNPCSKAVGCSVPAFFEKEGVNGDKKFTTTRFNSSTTNISHHRGFACKSSTENSIMSKDLKTDTVKDGLAHITNNSESRVSTMGMAHFEDIPEERFSQSCTFLRSHHLNKDFKLYSNELENCSFKSQESISLPHHVTEETVQSKTHLLKKSAILESKHFSNSEDSCRINVSESSKCTKNVDILHSMSVCSDQTATVRKKEDRRQTMQSNYISPLSSLYEDVTGTESVINVKNKQLDNRKRKYNSVFAENNDGGMFKRKSVGKVRPMTKVIHNENEKYLSSMEKLPPVENYSLNSSGIREHQIVKKSPISDDTTLLKKNFKNTKHPTKCIGTDCQTQSNSTDHRDGDCIFSESLYAELQPSNMVSQIEKSDMKENLFKKDVLLRKFEEQNTKPSEIIVNNTKSRGNPTNFEKQQTVLKNELPQYSKSGSKYKAERNSSHILNLQPCEKMSVSQKENLECKSKATGKVQPSKNNDKGKIYHNSAIHEQSSVQSSVSLRAKLVDDEKQNKSIISSMTIQKLNSNGKQKKVTSSKPQTFTATSNFMGNTNRNNDKSSILKKIPSNIEKHLKNLIQVDRSKNDGDVQKMVAKPSSSILSRNGNGGFKQKKIIPQKGKQVMEEKYLQKNSVSHKLDRQNKCSDRKSTSQVDITHVSNKKCSDKMLTSKRQIIHQAQDCKVARKKESSVVIEKPEDKNNILTEKSDTKTYRESKPNLERLQTHDKEKFTAEKSIVLKNQVGSKVQCTKNAVIPQREMNNEHGCIEKPMSCENNKINDLVRIMKGLTQTEALKVINEFASTLPASEYVQQPQASKDQRLPTNEDVYKTTLKIKSKNKIIGDYSNSSFEFQNNINTYLNPKKECEKKSITTMMCNDEHSSTVPSQPVQQTRGICEVSYKIKPPVQKCGVNANTKTIKVENCLNSLNSSNEDSFKTLSNTSGVYDMNLKTPSVKCNSNKKKKSELDRIHADLESCHGLEDIMMCSGIRSCRLKNKLVSYSENKAVSSSKVNITDVKQRKKRKVSEPEDELFYFIEHEITIKEEPIPELPFNCIKQEPEEY